MTESMYLALDFPSWIEANNFLEKNNLQGVPVKIGMELYYKEGPKIIEKLKQNNHKIFLDLKLFDIPTTVKRTMNVLSSLEVDMVNIHAIGGADMIRRAKEGLMEGNTNSSTKLIAVTILTSMEQKVLNEELRIKGSLMDTAVNLSRLSKENGVDGVVCSVQEVKAIKEVCGENFVTVTPGIRLVNTEVNDQKRIATPSLAKEMGADFIVIGRSITQSKSPNVAYEQAVLEWRNGHVIRS